jgi:hypothetical protein
MDGVKQIKRKQKSMLAVLLYGEFRKFELHLKRNIEAILGDVIGEVHFYILTEQCEGYNEKKNKIISIIESYGYQVKYFETIDSCSQYNKEEEDILYNDYHSIPCWDRDNFTPKLLYRRRLIHRIMKSFHINYEKVMLARLFDVIIKKYKLLSFINNKDDTSLYYAVDSFIISIPEKLDIFLKNDLISNIIEIPEEKKFEFNEFYKMNDNYLASTMPKLALETIYMSILFKNFTDTCNLRFDYTKERVQYKIITNYQPENESVGIEIDRINGVITYKKWDRVEPLDNSIDDYLFIYHCPLRKN